MQNRYKWLLTIWQKLNCWSSRKTATIKTKSVCLSVYRNDLDLGFRNPQYISWYCAQYCMQYDFFSPLPNHAALIPSISVCPLLAKEINQWVWTILCLTFQCTDTSFVSADHPPPSSQKRQDVAPSVDGHPAQWLSDRPVSGMRHFCLFALFFLWGLRRGGWPLCEVFLRLPPTDDMLSGLLFQPLELNSRAKI